MTDVQIIKSSLIRRDTDDLMTIWVEHDRRTWTESAFVAVREILQERGIEPPTEFGEEPARRHREQRSQANAAVFQTTSRDECSRPGRRSRKGYGFAIAACFCIVIAYSMLSSAMGWRNGGGAIPMLLFLLVLGGTWRALTKAT